MGDGTVVASTMAQSSMDNCAIDNGIMVDVSAMVNKWLDR